VGNGLLFLIWIGIPCLCALIIYILDGHLSIGGCGGGWLLGNIAALLVIKMFNIEAGSNSRIVISIFSIIIPVFVVISVVKEKYSYTRISNLIITKEAERSKKQQELAKINASIEDKRISKIVLLFDQLGYQIGNLNKKITSELQRQEILVKEINAIDEELRALRRK